MSKAPIALHVLNALIGSLSIVILGLTTDAIVVKSDFDDLPTHVESTGMGMLMWAGCGGVVDTLLLLGLTSAKTFHQREIAIPSALYRSVVLFVATFIVLRPLIILIYTYTESNQNVTPETWGCNSGTASDARSLCSELRAARYILIPVLVFAAGLLATISWVTFGKSHIASDGRITKKAQPNQQKHIGRGESSS